MKRKYIVLIPSMLIMFTIVLVLSVNKIIELSEYEKWEQEAANLENSYKDMEIFIDIIENRLYIIANGKVVKEYACASGKPGTPSPVGKWKVITKSTWGEGFGGRWMGLNVPWGTYGIHGTSKPGSIGFAASNGCIRMKNKDAAELYRIVKHGTPVVVYGGPYGSFGRGFRNIKPGDIGSDVLEVQKRLNKLGYYSGPLNGRYGPSLEASVYKFEKDRKLNKSKILNLKVYNAMGIILFE